MPEGLRWRLIAAAFVATTLWSLRVGSTAADDRPPEPETPPATSPPPAEPPAPQPGPAGASSGEESLLKAYYETGLDTGRGFSVTNLSFKKDAVTLLFKQGSLFLLKPIEGQVTGAVFMGDGQINYTPPNRTERTMIKKYAGAEVLSEPFTEAVLRFTDDSLTGLTQGARPEPGAAAKAAQAQALLADRNGWLSGTRLIGGTYLIDTTSFAPDVEWVEARASALPNLGTFIADVHTPKHDWLTYLNDPQRVNENVLFTSET